MRNTLKALGPTVATAGLLACGLAASFTAPATAAVPPQVSAGPSAGATRGPDAPGSSTHQADAHSHQGTRYDRTHHRSGKHRHKGGPGSSLGDTSTGIHLYNNSVDKLVLTDVTGPNQGVPPKNSVLASGVGSQDFEVTVRFLRSTTVIASYDVYDPTNTYIGNGAVALSNNGAGATSVTASFDAPPGDVQLPLTAAKYGKDFQITGTEPVTVDASSPTGVAMANNYCTSTNTNATCSFTPSSRTAGTQMHLLAEGYTIPGGGNTPGTVSVSNGYGASSSSSWSVTVTAQTEMADIFQAGISGTYGQSVTWTNTFTAAESIVVNPSYTGYIWGNSPVIDYTGTMQIKLGTTTYDLVNTKLATPDPSRKLSDFETGTYLGNDPLHSPDTPPASAVPLP